MKNNDTQLIHLTLDGDDNAFTELVDKYQKPVHTLVWRKIGDFHIAEEITQDTFLKAYQNLATLKKSQSFSSWLYVIATSLCRAWFRKKYRREQLSKDTDTTHPEDATYSEYVLAENERITTETQRDVVKKLLAKLGESERTVVTLHYFGDMSCSEIGAFLGVSTNTVKSRLRRAQQRLQKEETMIREALDNYQISTNLTENIMRKISRTKPAAPSSGKPLVPWAIAASTLAVVLLMLGFGNHKYLTRFQQPYSLDAQTDMSVEIIDAPVVANLESESDMRTQIERTNDQSRINNHQPQLNDAVPLSEEVLADETVENYTQWNLPVGAKARLGKGGINVMQFSSDGTRLAIGSSIGVWLYDAKTGKELTMLPGRCQSLTFSHDGRFLANGGGRFRVYGTSSVKELQLWEVATGRIVSFTDALPAARVLRLSDDGKELVSLDLSRDTINRFEFETGRKSELKINKQKGIGIGKSETYALSDDKLAIGEKNGKIELWDTKTGEKLSFFHEQDTSKRVFSLAFSPNGTSLASGSEDNLVRIWDLTSRKEPIILRKHIDWVNVLAFSPDGEILASGSTDKMVVLWNAITGELLTTLKGHINGIAALTFSPDGTLLVSGSTDGAIKFWDTVSGKQIPKHITGHTEWVKALSFINDSNTLASVAFNGIISFWDLKTLQKTYTQMKRLHDLLYIAAFSPDGTQLASTGSEGRIVFSRTGGFVGYTTTDSSVSLVDVQTGWYLEGLKTDGGPFVVAYSPNGKKVAFNSYSNVRVWDIETGSCLNIPLSEKWQLDHNGDVIVPPNLKPEDVPKFPIICALAFSPDNKMIVSGTAEGMIQLWDAEKGVELSSFTEEETEGEGISALSFTSNGALLAVGSRTRIRVMGSNKLSRLQEINTGAATLVFSPDDTVLVSGLINGAIELWDVESGDKLTALDGHSEPIETLVFSPDGKTLVSTGHDGTILLWDWDEVLKGSDQ